MNFQKEFLNRLYNKLEEYCVKNEFKIKEWLEYQELACAGGYQVFKDYCMENNKEVLLLQAELMQWDEFDDFIYELSKKLIENEEE